MNDADPTYFELFTRRDEGVLPFVAGNTIFQQGDEADCFYVVRRGTVRIHDGARELETVEAGGIFGEMALVDGSPRSATATAATNCELVPVDEQRFHALVGQAPYFAQSVMRVMAARLRNR